ncbi:SMAD/FHA domain-containing protein [Tuber magnatum]|uniref:SMAD/FHA domain-containing protein n=1 Tax=Tuber magnatum TaxID=42249 RepID=A0A317SFF8_9PEZI|nr:SMAD/FHA domain-containing protein [Tuber magnatum]
MPRSHPRSRSRSQSPPRHRYRRSHDSRDDRRRRDDRSNRDSDRERWYRRDEEEDERPHRHDDYDDDRYSERRQRRDGRDRGHTGERRIEARDSKDRSRGPSSPAAPDERLARRAAASIAESGALEAPKDREEANFNTTGLLAAASNTTNGVVLKYSEPSEARKPPGSQRWRLFVFKDKDIIDTIDLNSSSCWLIGRDRAVVDLPVDHPSCSKQHAVIQFRFVTKTSEFGDRESGVRPYLLDLESANGTGVAGKRIPESRYVELKDGDLITFGLSTREYVLMLEKD